LSGGVEIATGMHLSAWRSPFSKGLEIIFNSIPGSGLRIPRFETGVGWHAGCSDRGNPRGRRCGDRNRRIVRRTKPGEFSQAGASPHSQETTEGETDDEDERGGMGGGSDGRAGGFGGGAGGGPAGGRGVGGCAGVVGLCLARPGAERPERGATGAHGEPGRFCAERVVQPESGRDGDGRRIHGDGLDGVLFEDDRAGGTGRRHRAVHVPQLHAGTGRRNRRRLSGHRRSVRIRRAAGRAAGAHADGLSRSRRDRRLLCDAGRRPLHRLERQGRAGLLRVPRRGRQGL
jgi:hypothetical protein